MHFMESVKDLRSHSGIELKSTRCWTLSGVHVFEDEFQSDQSDHCFFFNVGAENARYIRLPKARRELSCIAAVCKRVSTWKT